MVDELPPFSFSKKPIKNSHLTSAISSFISNVVVPDTQPPQKPSFNNINYDEQIRAPRMSVANHYTYKPELPRPFTDRRSESDQSLQFPGDESAISDSSKLEQVLPTASNVPVRLDSTQNDEGSLEKKLSRHQINEARTSSALETLVLADVPINPHGLSPKKSDTYLPATADLNRPTRRLLEPQPPRWGVDSGILGDYAPLVNPQDIAQKINNDTSDHFGSDSSDASAGLLVQLKLRRAIDNLNNNVTTAERYDRSDRSDLDLAAHLNNDSRGPAIKQVYHMKKPMCLPAVLRPLSSESMTCGMKRVEPQNSPGSSGTKTTVVEMDSHNSTIPQQVSMEIPDDAAVSDQKVEPTHEHWKPNNSTDHCLSCFGEFGGFFLPQRLRRHHCRFCGLLYCQNCLYNNRELHMFEITSPISEQPTTNNSEIETEEDHLISNSGLSSSTGLTQTTAVLFDENAGGVMLDCKARFVIPVFRNLPPEGVSRMQQKHKVCKVCKTCGSGYLKLMQVLNQPGGIKDDINSGYVFIENPYLNNPSELDSRDSVATKASMPERRVLLAKTPDWTWSSF